NAHSWSAVTCHREYVTCRFISTRVQELRPVISTMERIHNSKNRTVVKDPVCGMSVDPASAAGAYSHAGQEYFFCSLHCLERFRTRPETYLNKPLVQPSLTADASKTPEPGGDFTCPMHPEVRQEKAGPCPRCGMALEPRAGRAAIP